MTFYMNSISFIVLSAALIIAQEIFATQGPRFKTKTGHKLNTCFKNYTYTPNDSTDHSKCYTLSHPYCLDIELPYRSVALPDHVPDLSLNSIEDVQVQLQRWQNVSKLPRCWPNFQVMLCSIFLPRCEEDPINRRLIKASKPSYDSCNDIISKGECKFIDRHFGWPSFFNCNDTNLYMKDCSDELRGSTVQNPSHKCPSPLVYSEDPRFWVDDIANCAISHKFPIVDENDDTNIKSTIAFASFLGLATTTIAILMFQYPFVSLSIRDQPSLSSDSRKTEDILRNFTISQAIFYCGWAYQFIVAANIASAPGGIPNIGARVYSHCGLSFFLTYVSFLYNTLCHAYLGKSIYYDLVGRTKDKKPSVRNSFEIPSELLFLGPFVLFVIVAALEQIDGNGPYGVCTTGQQSTLVKSLFIWVPRSVGLMYGNYYFMQLVRRLMRQTPNPTKKRIYKRIIPLVLLSFLELVTSLWIYAYELKHSDSWKRSIEKLVVCGLDLKSELDFDSGTRQVCLLESKPNLVYYYADLLSVLAPGIIVASWTLRRDNLEKVLSFFRHKRVEYGSLGLAGDVNSLNPMSTVSTGSSIGNASTTNPQEPMFVLCKLYSEAMCTIQLLQTIVASKEVAPKYDELYRRRFSRERKGLTFIHDIVTRNS